ncbi:MAG: hypothetical protein JSU68_04725, partial [Phycisphaerales bacterium]
MKRVRVLVSALALVCLARAGETLFTAGPQEYGGQRYYWLAQWRLEVTLPDDLAPNDRLEVLFGSKGVEKRTLFFEHEGVKGSLAEGGWDGYRWIEVLRGPGKKVVLFGKGRELVAFLAGVRITGKSASRPKVRAIPTASGLPSGDGRVVWADLAGFEVNEETRRLWNPSPETPDWTRAERSARYAGIALNKVQRWLHERCLPVRDARSGLFRPTGRQWNYRDTAADCYPFYVWAAYYTDKEVLDTVMVDVLKAEQRLCNHLDRLPVPYDMDGGRKNVTSIDRIIFGASEYAKDGLIPIVEITGKDYPWYDRMRGLVDDIFAHAPVETPYGKIPSKNIEVNGELLQLLPRLYCMTREKKYLDWAHRLADYYLLPGRFVPSRLSDHGCEIIGGLGLLFAVDSTACPERRDRYRPHLEYMFKEILRRGTNSDGIIIGTLQDTEGPHDTVGIRDGWGYDFVGLLDYDMALGVRRHYEAIRRPLTNLLKPRYRRFNWDHNSRDNVADSVEGGLYLLYRIPTTAGFVWADREIATLLVDHAHPDRLWDTHKLEANTVRTVLIHTMLHTRNTIARPWRQGLQLGAAPYGRGICIFMQSDRPYEGRIQFDIPRHRIHMGFRQDWPRMNAVPEWFTVEPDDAH